MYNIVFSDKANEQFGKLEKTIKDRMLKTLQRIVVRPYSFVEWLSGSDLFKLRVGDYRILLDIYEDKLVVLVVELGRRKNIYK